MVKINSQNLMRFNMNELSSIILAKMDSKLSILLLDKSTVASDSSADDVVSSDRRVRFDIN